MSKEAVYQKELKRLAKEKISSKNKQLIKAFHNSLFSKGCSELRVAKLSSQLRYICKDAAKDLDSLRKSNLEALLTVITKKEGYSLATREDYKRCIKQFYRWYEDEDSRLYKGSFENRKRQPSA